MRRMAQATILIHMKTTLNLDDDLRCRLFGRPERPAFCASLRPMESMCGNARADAMQLLAELEAKTAPA